LRGDFGGCAHDPENGAPLGELAERRRVTSLTWLNRA
jgi:hypothetical protein